MKRPLKSLILLSIALLAVGCSPVLKYSMHSTYGEGEDLLQYISTAPKKPTNKYIFYLTDNIDSTDLSQSVLFRYFIRKGFRLVIPIVQQTGAGYQQRLLNSEHIFRDLFPRDSDSVEIVLLGIGEGAHIAASLSQSVNEKMNILINCSPYSLLKEYELWGKSDSISPGRQFILNQMNISSVEELTSRVKKLKGNVYGTDQIPPYSNDHWMSYYENEIWVKLLNTYTPVYWINFKDSPTISKQSHSLIETTPAFRSNIKYTLIDGKGNLNNEDDLKSLLKYIKTIDQLR